MTRKYQRRRDRFRVNLTKSLRALGAGLFVRKLARENPGLFVHWKAFGTRRFA